MAIERRSITRVGDPAPDITLTALDGRRIGLRDFRGSRLVVFCWASW